MEQMDCSVPRTLSLEQDSHEMPGVGYGVGLGGTRQLRLSAITVSMHLIPSLPPSFDYCPEDSS